MRVVLLSLSDPDGPQTGGTLRTKHMARAFEIAGHEVIKVFPATAATAEASGVEGVGESWGERALPGMLRTLKRHYLPMPSAIGASNAQLRKVLGAARPVDLLVVSALSQAGFAAVVPEARVWTDFMDLWSEMARGEAAQRRGGAAFTARLQAKVLRRREHQQARGSAVTTAAGWRDAENLRRAGCLVEWMPTTVTVTGATPPPPDRIVGMLANFHYWPNSDAYVRLVRDWAPRLVDAGWRCSVAGFGSLELPESPLVERWGPIAEVGEYYARVSATMAPIALGGGMKVKVVESLLHGRPVLASGPAVEGLPPDVAALVGVTDLVVPDVRLLESASVDPLSRALRPYSPEHLQSRVEATLAGL